MSDDRERYGLIVHEAGAAWSREQEPSPGVTPWALLEPWQRELAMRIGSAVAVRAAADAKLRNERLELEAATVRAHLPAILDALSSAVTGAEYEALAKPYRAALEALGGTGGTGDQDRTDEKEDDRG